VTACKFLAFRK